MKTLNSIAVILLFCVLTIASCSKKDETTTPAGTCADGIKNQTETGVDCGGPCGACATCSDGIKNQNETGIDCGGPCAACATCSDGIQNQGETGVDCGGPCPNACAFNNVCTGNGQNVYFPLKLNNEWTYSALGWPDMVYTITGTQVYNSTTYHHVHVEDGFGGSEEYYRAAANGDIYQYNTGSGQEYLEVPASPAVNQTWTVNGGSETYKVISLTASWSTSSCSYTNCLQIDVKDAGGSDLWTLYFKKGVGRVGTYYGPPLGSLSLKSLTLY